MTEEPSLGFAALRPCVACRISFDFVRAEFCDCLSTDRTFACPHCGSCACSELRAARNEFWEGAPRILWERRRQQANESMTRLQALDRDTVIRPLAMVVDDDPRVLQQAAAALHRLGFTTLLLDRPDAAAQIARSVVPDLILTDALMPQLDGRELCRRLKSDPETSSIRVIVMSSLYKGAVYRNEAFRTFLVDEYLDKPVRPALLQDAVQRLVPALVASTGGAMAHASAG